MAKRHSSMAPILKVDSAGMSEQPMIAKTVQHEEIAPRGQPSRRRVVYLLPGIGFVGLAAVLTKGLTQDPKLIPSALVGKLVPNSICHPSKAALWDWRARIFMAKFLWVASRLRTLRLANLVEPHEFRMILFSIPIESLSASSTH